MGIQQFRVTLGAARIDVCGDYTPAEALQAARDALEGCFAAGCSVRVLLCVAAVDDSGQWVRFDDVTTAAAIPNLDAETPEALMAFWNKHQSGRAARELFPEGGKGTRRATADLANYAANKATAMRCRLAGSITGAQQYESICDRIYSRLPEFARAVVRA